MCKASDRLETIEQTKITHTPWWFPGGVTEWRAENAVGGATWQRAVCSKIKNKFYHKKANTTNNHGHVVCSMFTRESEANSQRADNEDKSTEHTWMVHTYVHMYVCATSPQIKNVFRWDRSDYIRLALNRPASSLFRKEPYILACLFVFLPVCITSSRRDLI